MHRGALFALFGGVVTLTGCVLLVPGYGIVGAAFAALAGMSQAALFELWAHHEAQARFRFARFALWRTARALAICAGGAAAVTAAVRIALPTGWAALIGAAVAASVAYVALWFGLALAVREERVLLGRATRWLRARR
jgi:O-antigen/teichoic acid export membrane protein